MSLQSWQDAFQVVLFFGIILTAVGTGGAYYYGNKISAQKEAAMIKVQAERDTAVAELKTAIQQIPSKQMVLETQKELSELRAKATSSAQKKAVRGQ
jgi:hypothetical protein